MNNQSINQVTGAPRVAFVTGAASGIGAAVCRMLTAQGVAIAAADQNEAGLAALRDSLGGETRFLSAVLDVRDEAAQQAFVHDTESRLGEITDVVPCAGLARSAPAETMSA